MRILAVSDMHGNLDNIFVALELVNADLLLCCGDWGEASELDPAALQEILERIPVFTVYGNHDDIDLLSAARNRDGTDTLLPQGEIQTWGGLTFAGISGIWAKSHAKPYYVTDTEVAEIASRLAGKDIDIFMSHGCPIGLADTLPGGRHGGSRCFLDAFHAIQPRVYLCGHLHAPQIRSLKNGSTVINIGSTCQGDYWMIGIDGGKVSCEQGKI